MRYSLDKRPAPGTEVKISPILNLTLNLTIPSSKHTFSGKGAVGIVISDREYFKSYRNYKYLVKFKNLVPVKIEDEVLLFHPSFLVVNRVIKKQRRSMLDGLLNKIEDRLAELQANSNVN